MLLKIKFSSDKINTLILLDAPNNAKKIWWEILLDIAAFQESEIMIFSEIWINGIK